MLRDCGAIDLIPAPGKQRRFREATWVPWPSPQPRATQEITRAERKGTNVIKTTQAISGGITDDDSPGDNSIPGISSIHWHKGTSHLLAFFKLVSIIILEGEEKVPLLKGYLGAAGAGSGGFCVKSCGDGTDIPRGTATLSSSSR